MKFSVVLPIHNEKTFLRYSLPSIFKLQPDEVILIFDRCTDGSFKTAEKITKYFHYMKRTRFITLIESSPDWKFRIAFVRRYGFQLAKNDIILNTDADIILDPIITVYLPYIGSDSVALISFERRLYPNTIRSCITRLIYLIIPKAGFTGTYAFSKKAWLETENSDSVKQVLKAEDTHLHLSIAKKFKTHFIRTNTIHLREKETRSRHYSKGIVYWTVKRNPLWKAILHSIIYLRPLMLAGYLHARLKNPIEQA